MRRQRSQCQEARAVKTCREKYQEEIAAQERAPEVFGRVLSYLELSIDVLIYGEKTTQDQGKDH